jgi:hypothetical protein
MAFNVENKNLQKIKPVIFKHIKPLFDSELEINNFTFSCHQKHICDADYFFDDHHIDHYYCEHGDKACKLLGLAIENYQKSDNHKGWILDELNDLNLKLIKDVSNNSNLKFRVLNEFWINARDLLMSELNGKYEKIFSNLGSLDYIMVDVYRDGNVTFELIKHYD